ncbi:alpha/beta hydrolase [Telmatospirillum sp. J64-1]|uniref:alpha/beta hydrolase n=1 Tax=Telmatospirillum sp. J64-1 TaxID=2502183 RepID=UPI00163D6D86|nr:alpha/beta hydrolase-fold protein [Telmatospirillum sp. J64-1]
MKRQGSTGRMRGAGRRGVAGAILALALAASATGGAQAQAQVKETGGPATIARSEVHDIQSPESGETYRLMLWRPAAPPPPGGYPVIYMLDGNARFGMITDILDSRTRRVRATGIQPAVVAAIGYPTEDPFDDVRRSYDLTPPSETLSLPQRPDGTPWPRMGGAAAFLRFIESEVKPLVRERFPIDETRETLMGHSFGGLFTLHTLFTSPDSFDSYIAGSPSLWFNDRQVLKEGSAFAARLKQQPAKTTRLFLAVGGLEEVLTPSEQQGPDPARRLAWKQANRMVGNARDLAADLQGLEEHGLHLTYVEFPDEDHISILPVLLNRSLEAILTPG